MSQSQVVSFRASGHFLNWIEAQRLDGESVNQAAQRILKEVSGTSTVPSTTLSTDLSTRNNDSVASTNVVDIVDKAVADCIAPLIQRIAAIEERLEQLGVSLLDNH
ncbi:MULTISPECIES: hypothetical protein [unclassified Microcoleus]|uniref:hypothetical protein n=1 Tax=unclassified Microcoleus TaxID=2642155 RepID=UPI002FD4014B